MAELRVWAPRAQAVEAELRNDIKYVRAPMKADERGWFRFEHDALQHGTDYSLWLDGKGPYPDPRSRFQPHGIHGASRWVDHDAFSWNDASWRPVAMSDAVLYELHVGTFSEEESFAGVSRHLNYLKELGVTHIELMPVAEFPGVRAWGYDGVELYAPHHAYGGPEGLKHLVNDCHREGLGVILDVVYNHLGPLGNNLNHFGPYFTDKYCTPWGAAINLDGPGSDEVRRFFIDNALMWLRDYHIDGLRVDAIHAFLDTSAMPFLEQLTSEVKALGTALGRDLLLIAESNLNDPRTVREREAGGLGFDLQWNDDFHHALHTLLTEERAGYYQDFGEIADLAKVLQVSFRHDNCYSRYRQRHHGRSAAGIEGSKFIVGLQNHDQIGNRATGERIGHLAGPAQVKMGAAITLLGPFVPMLFQGEEWSASTPFQYFTNFDDAQLHQAVRKGRQEEFSAFGYDPASLPDPEEEGTWRCSKLNWDEQGAGEHREILDWYRALLRLRRSESDFAAGPLDPEGVVWNEQLHWLRFRRGRFVVLCNFANVTQPVPLPTPGTGRIKLSSDVDNTEREDGNLLLQPHSIAVVESFQNDNQGPKL